LLATCFVYINEGAVFVCESFLVKQKDRSKQTRR
jgi:hypothetical protein